MCSQETPCMPLPWAEESTVPHCFTVVHVAGLAGNIKPVVLADSASSPTLIVTGIMHLRRSHSLPLTMRHAERTSVLLLCEPPARTLFFFQKAMDAHVDFRMPHTDMPCATRPPRGRQRRLTSMSDGCIVGTASSAEKRIPPRGMHNPVSLVCGCMPFMKALYAGAALFTCMLALSAMLRKGFAASSDWGHWRPQSRPPVNAAAQVITHVYTDLTSGGISQGRTCASTTIMKMNAMACAQPFNAHQWLLCSTCSPLAARPRLQLRRHRCHPRAAPAHARRGRE